MSPNTETLNTTSDYFTFDYQVIWGLFNMGKVKEVLIVKSKVKDYVKSLGDFNVAGDFVDALNEVTAKILKNAAERTKANGRKTVSAKDI